MATQVFTTEVVSLQDEDETEVVLRPLVIKQLKKFMSEWKRIENEVKAAAEDENAEPVEDSDIIVRLTMTCLERQLRKKFSTEKQYKDFLEDSCDMDTMHEIIRQCTGVSFGEPDPKLLAMLEEAKEDGTA